MSDGPSSRLPGTVVALGIVSLLMDVSSEMVHSLLPLFVITELHASTTVFGVIEGAAEATVMVVKLFSGALSDRLQRRKSVALAGYGLAALTKPLFAVAGSVSVLFAARLLDRVGKGIRGAPRDALIADVTPSGLRGAAYGLRQSLDSIGAVAGPLLASGLMWLYGDVRQVYAWAILPAAGSVAVLALGVREPAERRHPEPKSSPGPAGPRLARFGRGFTTTVAIGSVFTLARSSEGFLVLRALDVGASAVSAPLAMVGMNVVYSLLSYPVGKLGDRMDRRVLLALGALTLCVADAVLALASSLGGLALGVALWGMHLGLSQGLLSALVADTAPPELRGTAFGVFNLATGVATLVASLLAGVLWDLYGPRAAFSVSAVLAGLAALGSVAALGPLRLGWRRR